MISKANIVLMPDGSEIAVDGAGVNALVGMATPATEVRPLLVENVRPGPRTVAVVFDVADLADLEIDIEGLRFEVPNP